MKPSFPFFFLILILSFQSCSTAQSLQDSKVDDLVKKQMPAAITEHRALVSLPCDAFYPKDMIPNIDWLKAAFEKRNFKVKVLETPSIPIVLAERIVNEKLPTVLFYIHFDGQPVDASKWDQDDPFKPVIKKQKPNGEWK